MKTPLFIIFLWYGLIAESALAKPPSEGRDGFNCNDAVLSLTDARDLFIHEILPDLADIRVIQKGADFKPLSHGDAYHLASLTWIDQFFANHPLLILRKQEIIALALQTTTPPSVLTTLLYYTLFHHPDVFHALGDELAQKILMIAELMPMTSQKAALVSFLLLIPAEDDLTIEPQNILSPSRIGTTQLVVHALKDHFLRKNQKGLGPLKLFENSDDFVLLSKLAQSPIFNGIAATILVLYLHQVY